MGDPKEPLKADVWLEQMMKTFEMLGIKDGGLRVTLTSFQLKGDAGQWWKYAQRRIGETWEAIVKAFQDKYLPAIVREKLRDQFSPVAEFEATFTSLSRFALELVVTEERRCLEFKKRLRTGLEFRVVGSMIRDYARLVEAAVHLETIMHAEEERTRGSRRSQEGQGDSKRQRGSNPQ